MFLDFFKHIEKQLDAAKRATVKAYEDAYTSSYAYKRMAALNVDQMNRGVTRDLNDIRPSYRERYAAYKQSIGKSVKGAPMTPNLRLTGSFHKKLYAKQQGEGVRFDSRDKKTRKLNTKYNRIFALHSSSILILQHDPKIQKQVLNGIIQATRSA